MSVTPGSKIAFSDLQALATLANGKPQYDPVTAPNGLQRYVSPLYTDGSGNPYGYQRFSGVFIYAAGINYKPGDSLSLGFGSVFTVEMVSATGGVLGIRYVNLGAGLYSDSASSPASASGGSGSGCQLGFSFGQYGPTAAYDFGAMGLGLDFDPTLGNVTDYYIVYGGAGYAVGNTLGFTEQPTTVLTVATVDGSGKILTFTKTTGTSAIVIPQNVASMNATGGAGTGAKFGGYFTLAQKPQWLTELNRMRGNIFGLYALNQNIISGPWPISGYVNSFTVNASNLVFYYANATTTQTATISSITGQQLSDEAISDYLSGVVAQHKTSTFRIRVGGDKSVSLSGSIMVSVLNYSTTPVSLIVTTTLPGATITYNYTDGWCEMEFSSVAISPGEYTITASTTDSTGYIFDQINNNPFLSVSYLESNYTPTNGIDGSFPVNKITLPQSDATYGMPFGVWGKGVEPGSTASRQIFIGFTSPPYNPGQCYWGASSIQGSTSCYGFLVGNSPAVSSLNVVTPGLMPWNLQRTKYGSSGQATVNPSLLGDLAANISNVAEISNSYDQSLPVESQVELPGWIASRYFTLGFNIVDSNGNFQIVTTAGITGASAPAWPTTENGTVTDGTVHWNCRRVLAATAAWSTGAKTLGSAIKDSNGNTQVVTTAGTSAETAPTWATMDGQTTVDGSVIWEKRSPFSPIQHRAQAVPVYPFYWQGNNALPTTWVAATAYALNATVIDANGNTQQCTTAGTSAATAPVWSLTLAGVTSDGATLKWTLITLAAETSAFLKPPTATSGLTRWGANDQWQRNNWGGPYGSSYDAGWQYDNLAMGWWIYSVSINRMMLNPASQVAVTIGCIRNGSFVAFGTWNTGQTIQVLWPVFTSDALVYQCGERVDIQAVAIASSGAGVSTGATVSGYPICAAFVSDTTALLNLL